MIRLNHHKHSPGFTFIEVLIALMLLSIAGTSLFMMQTHIFQQTAKTHRFVQHLLLVDQEIVTLMPKIHDAIKQQKNINDIKLNEPLPENITRQVSITSIKEASSLFKLFKENIHVMTITIQQDKTISSWTGFIRVPPKEQSKDQQPKGPN